MGRKVSVIQNSTIKEKDMQSAKGMEMRPESHSVQDIEAERGKHEKRNASVDAQTYQQIQDQTFKELSSIDTIPYQSQPIAKLRASYIKTKSGHKTRMNHVTELSPFEKKQQQGFKNINYNIPKKAKPVSLIGIEDQRGEQVLEYEDNSNVSSFRFGSQRHEKTYDQPRSISDLDQYRTKDFFKQVDARLDTNDLYQNATKLKQLYQLMKAQGIPENHMSKRASQKFRDLEYFLQNQS